MDDFKTYGLAIFTLFFSSIEAINPELKTVVLLLTIISLGVKIYKDLKSIKK
jgi:hypothetical protein